MHDNHSTKTDRVLLRAKDLSIIAVLIVIFTFAIRYGKKPYEWDDAATLARKTAGEVVLLKESMALQKQADAVQTQILSDIKETLREMQRQRRGWNN